jgi:hypothetical protein
MTAHRSSRTLAAAIAVAGAVLPLAGAGIAQAATTDSGSTSDQPSSDQSITDQSTADQAGADQTGTDQTGTDQTGTDQTGTDQTGTDQTDGSEPTTGYPSTQSPTQGPSALFAIFGNTAGSIMDANNNATGNARPEDANGTETQYPTPDPRFVEGPVGGLLVNGPFQ